MVIKIKGILLINDGRHFVKKIVKHLQDDKYVKLKFN